MKQRSYLSIALDYINYSPKCAQGWAPGVFRFKQNT